jgi:hypothetical protein
MDAWVEVVNLGREVYEVILTSVEVDSDETKRTFVNRAIRTHVHTTHKTHVGVEKQGFSASIRISTDPGALNICDTDKAVEVVDR